MRQIFAIAVVAFSAAARVEKLLADLHRSLYAIDKKLIPS
jgi:hypothetical protein